jgi:hypothetical protein
MQSEEEKDKISSTSWEEERLLSEEHRKECSQPRAWEDNPSPLLSKPNLKWPLNKPLLSELRRRK